MLTNIVDHRTDRNESFTFDARIVDAKGDRLKDGTLRLVTIQEMMQHIAAKFPHHNVVLHLYDMGTFPEVDGDDYDPVTLHYQSEFQVSQDKVEREDGGQALIYSQDPISQTGPGADGKFFVRLQSWDDKDFMDDTRAHTGMRTLIDQRVRVTIEIVGHNLPPRK